MFARWARDSRQCGATETRFWMPICIGTETRNKWAVCGQNAWDPDPSIPESECAPKSARVGPRWRRAGGTPLVPRFTAYIDRESETETRRVRWELAPAELVSHASARWGSHGALNARRAPSPRILPGRMARVQVSTLTRPVVAWAWRRVEMAARREIPPIRRPAVQKYPRSAARRGRNAA